MATVRVPKPPIDPPLSNTKVKVTAPKVSYVEAPAPPPTPTMASLLGFPQQQPPVMVKTATPEEKIKIIDSAGLKSGDYSKRHITGLVQAAKQVGLDPSELVSLALQESGIGTSKIKMRRGRVDAPMGMVHDFSPQQEKELEDTAKSSGVSPDYLKIAIALRDKKKYAQSLGLSDEASQLQAYNGLGTITKKNFGGADKAYGQLIGAGIDLRHNPLYGKRLLALKADIAKNKEINDIINSIK